MNDHLDVGLDYRIITSLVSEKSTVLDLGCGDGTLMSLLAREKKVRAQGVEIDEEMIYSCVARGLNVFLGDLDSGLEDYDDNAFDYVILNQCLQQLKHPDAALSDALRVGKKVIVGFPNFAHISVRLQIFFQGRTPSTTALPYPWYETPNLHFVTVRDFLDYCRLRGVRIVQRYYTAGNRFIHLRPNLFAENAIMLLSKE